MHGAVDECNETSLVVLIGVAWLGSAARDNVGVVFDILTSDVTMPVGLTRYNIASRKERCALGSWE